MCGIAVAVNWPGAEQVVADMVNKIMHRGNISDPILTAWPATAAGTRRLPIVDPSFGVQPMLSANGRILLSFNGEIYNYRALRAELEGLGLRFRTDSDTEVLATAIEAWGASALPRLVGTYAFVALDLWKRDYLAARDPLGVIPLYLLDNGERRLFCSEIAPLLGASEAGEVLFLPPGHLLTRQLCLPFSTPFTQPIGTGSASARELDAILESAVAARVPDLPFALMFSGGIDSSLIAHYTRRLRPEAPGYFLGDSSAPDYVFARLYADIAGLDLRTVPLPAQNENPGFLIDAVVQAVESFEPATVRGAVGNYLISERIHADGYCVALCGDGADELFAGYRPHELGYAAAREVGDVIRNQTLATMSRDNLQQLDRCSMRFQIEVREPFLDPSVIAFALRSDIEALLVKEGNEVRGKAVLREIFNLYPGTMPPEIRDRLKTPFNEGCGFDRTPRDSLWVQYAEAVISDSELLDGARRFEKYRITSKEELLYFMKLSDLIEVDRVPHLADRLLLNVPRFARDEELADFSISQTF